MRENRWQELISPRWYRLSRIGYSKILRIEFGEIIGRREDFSILEY